MNLIDYIKGSFLLLRPDVLVFGVALVLFGSLFVTNDFSLLFLFLIINVICLFGGANSIDEYFDFKYDSKNLKNRLISPLSSTPIPKRWAVIQGVLLYCLAIVLILHFFSPCALLFAFLFMAITATYSFSIFDLKKRGIPRVMTNVIALSVLFLMPSATFWIWTPMLCSWAIVVGVSLFVFVMTHDLKDHTMEKKQGMRTLSVKLGLNKTAKVIGVLLYLPILLILLFSVLGHISTNYIWIISITLLTKLLLLRSLKQDLQSNLKRIDILAIADLVFSLIIFSVVIYLILY